MSEKLRANRYLFFADLLADVMASLRRHVTVMRLVLEGRDGAPDMELELRVTKVGKLKYPAVRSPLTKSQFVKRLEDANAHRIKEILKED